MRFDPSTALIVVDVQNDFADPSGGLAVADGAQVIPVINEMVNGVWADGGYVVYTQDWHPPVTPHFAKDGGVWPVHCVGHTWGAEFHPELIVDGPSVKKGTNGEDGYSGFTMRDPETGDTKPTELEALLRDRDIERVVVVGLALDYCVKDTALDAARLGFEVIVPLEATRPVDLEEGDGQRAADSLTAAGCTVA